MRFVEGRGHAIVVMENEVNFEWHDQVTVGGVAILQINTLQNDAKVIIQF